MAIYHMQAKIVSRGKGRSAVAASAYMSCSSVTNEYDGVHHDYTRKKGLVWEQVFLPENAPVEWQDRAILWNAVEDAEKSKDSRLAREFVVALPRELNADQQIALLTEYIQQQFVADGMCADVGIHDPDTPGHNPHAHILLTIRPLDDHGKWQYKTEKEYLCIRGDEERGFTASEFLQAQNEGWEKQYPYLVGKKKVYMTTADGEAQGLKRASKHPKSTTYGRQNPITERWNSESQLILWRSAWADIVNLHLERVGSTERVDHRSHAERGLDEQPTIHEGVAARAMEKKGIISDRCELNRQIKADNALLRELKDLVSMLTELVADAASSITDQLTKLREKLIVICYQIKAIVRSMDKRTATIQATQPKLKRYNEVMQQTRQKTKARKALVAEQKNTSKLNLIKQHDLSRQITTLTEESEELLSEKENLLLNLGCADDAGVKAVQSEITAMEASLHKLDEQKEQYSVELDETLQQYKQLQSQAEAGSDEIQRNASTTASTRLQQVYGKRFDAQLLRDSQKDVAARLDESTQPVSIREFLHRAEQKPHSAPRYYKDTPER
ncbi:MAG TPA: mobilization protein [Clostridiales bacterium]|nr:mobilization protein [Clostridiales bacterium]